MSFEVVAPAGGKPARARPFNFTDENSCEIVGSEIDSFVQRYNRSVALWNLCRLRPHEFGAVGTEAAFHESCQIEEVGGREWLANRLVFRLFSDRIVVMYTRHGWLPVAQDGFQIVRQILSPEDVILCTLHRGGLLHAQ